MVRTQLLLIAIIFSLSVGNTLAAEPKLVAKGEWSSSVDDNRGYQLRGRLAIYEKNISKERREFVVYVELQDASDSVGGGMAIFVDMGKSDFRPENKSGLKCEMRDKDKKLIESTGYPFGGAVPRSEWIKLPADATIRVRTTPFGIYRPNAMAISPELGQLWVINQNDDKEYYLSGTFTVAPKEKDIEKDGLHIWRGTLELPPVKFKYPSAAK